MSDLDQDYDDNDVNLIDDADAPAADDADDRAGDDGDDELAPTATSVEPLRSNRSASSTRNSFCRSARSRWRSIIGGISNLGFKSQGF